MLEGMEGKVAIVTGAGRGLGRAEALEFGRQGVRVIVNDFGRALSGEVADNPADEVVSQIVSEGGEALASYGDVADWRDSEAMIRQGIEKFGQLDILVNNAGILRDRTIFNMTEEEWDAVIRTHLKGHFCMSRWAASYWREKAKRTGEPAYGRIINTSSEAFLSGAVGQPNYSAAKAGIVQLTLSAAQALGRYGVTANAICPRARTRMTEEMQGFDAKQGDFELFAPENVSPLVAFLASPPAKRISGQVFIVYGKMISVLSGPPVDRRFDSEEPWTPENVAETLVPFYEKREPVADGFAVRLGG